MEVETQGEVGIVIMPRQRQRLEWCDQKPRAPRWLPPSSAKRDLVLLLTAGSSSQSWFWTSGFLVCEGMISIFDFLFLCIHVQVCMYWVCAHRGQRTTSAVIIPQSLSSWFFETVSLVWSSPSRLGWLASKSRVPPASGSPALGLQMCATTCDFFLKCGF